MYPSKCIVTTWKPSSIMEWRAISTFLHEIEFLCFFYFLDTENYWILTDNEMFDKYIEAQHYVIVT